jgi:hypothetical protein
LCVGDEGYDGVLFGFCYVCWVFCYDVGFVVCELLWFAPEFCYEFLDLLFLFVCCCFGDCIAYWCGFGCVCWAGGL